MYELPDDSPPSTTTDNRPDDKCYGCPHYDEDYCWYVPCDDLVCNP